MTEVPQAQVARRFMEHKGYDRLEPVAVDKVDELPCWYFTYDLPEGRLELEVIWEDQEWQTTVTDFKEGS